MKLKYSISVCLFFALSLSLAANVAYARGFSMGEASVLSSVGEPLYAQIPLYGLSADSYSTLSGQVVGFDERVNSLNFKFSHVNNNIYFVITSRELMKSDLEVQVFLSYKGFKQNAEYRLVPKVKPVVDVPSAISATHSLQSNNTNNPKLVAQSDKQRYYEYTNQAVKRVDDKLILPFEYQIQRGDTISTIVNNHHNPYNASFHHSVLAMYVFNKHAFNQGDINQLIIGQTLIVPTFDQFFAIDESAARSQYYSLVNGGDIPQDLLSLSTNNKLVSPMFVAQPERQESVLRETELRNLASEIRDEIERLNADRRSIDSKIDKHEDRLVEINQMLNSLLASN